MATLGALALLLAAVPAAEAAFPGTNGRIAFASDRDGGDGDIFTMNADGTGVAQLTANGWEDRYPSWSADGTKIAFASNEDGGDFDIFTMNADGSGLTQLTFNSVADALPKWSADGSKIAFTSDQDGDFEVYVMNADGSGQTQLTFAPGSDVDFGWSPDGGKITFSSTRDGNEEIYVMNVDGSGQTRLTVNPALDGNSTWSPNGSKLAWRRDGAGNGSEVYVMNADGSAQTAVSNNPGFDADPAFSPDGAKIAFLSARDGDLEIYVMNADGSGQTRITNSLGYDLDIDWQPIPGYARPQAGAQFRVPLVPAYKECTSPNSSHGGGIAVPSCLRPEQASDYLTVGTIDANGFTPQSVGFVKQTVCVAGTTGSGVCSTPTGMTVPDIRLETRITDVRCRKPTGTGQGECEGGQYSDYIGQLQTAGWIRITDKRNGPSGTDSGTAQDVVFSYTATCAANPAGADETAIGGTCSVVTSANAVLPGSIAAGKRAVWHLDKVHVYDGGNDGLVSTGDNTLFAWQGLFTP